MEPVSTLFLAVAVLASTPATRRPSWDIEPPRIERATTWSDATVFLIPKDASGEVVRPATSSLIDTRQFSAVRTVSPREWLKLETAEYSEGQLGIDAGTAPSTAAMSAALSFIDAIPARLPLPRPMLSSSGELGLYWDLPLGYAEASFESDGTVVFFSRSNEGIEHFQDSLKVHELDTRWFWDAVGQLDEMQKQAA